MSVVISDIGPINYLIQIGRVEILGELFEKVILPEAVQDELLDEKAPTDVQKWADAPSDRVEIKGGVDFQQLPPGYFEMLRDLGPGEVEAIALAYEFDLPVILDDFDARIAARNCGLSIFGTLAILAEASSRKLLDYFEEVEKLRS